MKSIEVPAKLEFLEKVNGFVLEEIKEQCTSEELLEVGLVIEEIFVNIVKYAYTPSSGNAWISCGYNQMQKELTLEFKDEGVPFNPLNMLHPDIESDATNRKIGSLGIYLVTKCMDNVNYEHKEGFNVLTMMRTFKTA